MTKEKCNIAVIGGGFGGLSAAAYLSSEGHKVTLFEKNEMLGGRARTFSAKGFTFDMGPSWYLMPEVFESFFNDVNHTITYKPKKLNPSYRIFFPDNQFIDVPSDYEDAKLLFESLEKNGGDKFDAWMKKATYQYMIGVHKFVYKNYNSIFDFFTPELILKGSKMNIFQSLDSYAKKMFKNPKCRQILLYTSVFLGSDPKHTPAMYSLMSHVDFKQGVFYVKGGIGRVVKECQTVLEKNAVDIRYNSPVSRIIVSNGLAKGVVVNGKTELFDAVIVNADYAHAQIALLEKKYQDYPKSFWNKATIAPSGFILYLGVKKKLSKLKHHTLIFDDWQEHFTSIFSKKPSWPKSPSYYVCTPSKSDSSVAKKGQENLFILVPIASGIKDTEEIRTEYTQKIIRDLEEKIGPFSKDIIFMRSYSLKDFHSDYNAFKGTALGLSHTLLQTALFRPKNVSKKVKNVFYTGHYTVPGVGMPMAIISGKLAKERFDEYQSRI